MSKWISVSERLPDKPKHIKWFYMEQIEKPADEYIVTTKNGDTRALLWTGDKWVDQYIGKSFEVAAWMPLPEAYRAKSEKKMNDLISREAVLLGLINKTYLEGIELIDVSNMIKDLPAATPSRPKGEWVMNDRLYCPICNRCGTHPWKMYIPGIEEARQTHKFCPNCGADMRGEEDADSN